MITNKTLDKRLDRLHSHLKAHNKHEITELLRLFGIDPKDHEAEKFNESWNAYCTLVWESISKYVTGWKGWETF